MILMDTRNVYFCHALERMFYGIVSKLLLHLYTFFIFVLTFIMSPIAIPFEGRFSMKFC